MSIISDQMNRNVNVPASPQRIVSIVPSQTELLFDLGLDDRIVGITRFCIHPKDKCAGISKVGGTKKLQMEKIYALEPDLIIANKEENNKDQLMDLAERYPVWISDVRDLPGALNMIKSVGEMTKTQAVAEELIKNIGRAFSGKQSGKSRSVAYLIWLKPIMAAGGGTFIDSMLKSCGFKNVFEDMPDYPVLEAKQLAELDPELVLLSSEPYPFSEKHINLIQEFCPNAKVQLVDGEAFSWYGSRLLKSPKYFQKLRAKL